MPYHYATPRREELITLTLIRVQGGRGDLPENLTWGIGWGDRSYPDWTSFYKRIGPMN